MSENQKTIAVTEDETQAQPSDAAKQVAQAKPKPITDLSPRVVRLARLIDRLELDSKYIIVLKKGSSKEERWVISIEKSEEMRAMEL